MKTKAFIFIFLLPSILFWEPDTGKREIPVLCYHHVQKNTAKATAYTIGEKQFYTQMEVLYNSGYHTILPHQLYLFLKEGAALPSKPVMLTFDDTNEEHFSIVAPILDKFGFKGVFFIMTVPIGKANYMTAAQIRELSDSGHVIGHHTWDHQNVKTLKGEAWDVQIDKPKLQLERITGKPVSYFAYPYGAWNEAAIEELKKRGIKAAFQLSGKQSETEPLYTIRRLMVPGSWSAPGLVKEIHTTFNVP